MISATTTTDTMTEAERRRRLAQVYSLLLSLSAKRHAQQAADQAPTLTTATEIDVTELTCKIAA